MITVTWQGGRPYSGRTFDEVLKQMMDAAWFTKAEAPDQYMAMVARRAAVMEKTVRTSSAEDFYTDLENAGFVTIKVEAVQ